MAEIDSGSHPGRSGAPGRVGTAVSTQVGSGNILELLAEKDEPTAEDYPFWRQKHLVRRPGQTEDWPVRELTAGAGQTITATDAGKIVRQSGAFDSHLALPEITGTVAVGFVVMVDNQALNEGTMVVNAATGETVNGASSYTVANGNAALFEVVSDDAWSVTVPKDVLPRRIMFDQIIGKFTDFQGWAEYTDEGVTDNEKVTREVLDRLMMLPARQLVSEEIVDPGAGVKWRAEGFAKSPQVTIHVNAETDPITFVDPTAAISRAMEKVSMGYGGAMGFDVCIDPRLGNAVRTEHTVEGGEAGGWHRIEKQIARVVEQAYGFGVQSGDVLGIVGMFMPDTAEVFWKRRPTVRHGTTGDQFTEWKGTGRVSARYGLALYSPSAFARIVVA